jgi:hypothetical protein
MTYSKLRTVALTLAALVLTLLVVGSAEARPRRDRPVGPRWEFLGERTVPTRLTTTPCR